MSGKELDGDSRSERDSVTEVAEESFVRERPLEIERGAVLAGRYQVEEVIGKGGSGVVLRVFDRTVQNVVALKVLKSELARDAKWDKRFSRELRLGRPIQHRNVCRIFDIGEADGHRFLTMELATGGSLRDELKRRPALERSLDDRLADARAAIDGLAAIHAAGVVHRDFKPDNLLRMEDGRLVISDFGLATDAAHAPGVTVMIGTPHYMAPEVLAGEPATARSDVWALGVVLHEIFFGRRPERKSTSFDGSAAGPVRPATAVERAALALCNRCLAEQPADRAADAQEVRRLFDALTTERPGWWRPGRVAGLLAVGVLVAVSSGWVWHRLRKGRHNVGQLAAGGQSLAVSGVSRDWTALSSRLASFTGPIECLDAVDEHTVRVIWGRPRQATDLDVDSGQATPSKLLPAVYQVSCPVVSPKSKQLLFAARNAAGAIEIRMSNAPDGRDAVVLTSGVGPRWLGAHPAFVYSVDDLHVAVFSLSTMQLTLLPVGGGGRPLEVRYKDVNADGDVVALSGYDDHAEAWVELLRWRDEAVVGRFAVPIGSRSDFGPVKDDVLVAGPAFEKEQSVALLNRATGQLRRIGHVPGMDITTTLALGNRLVFADRRLTLDVWSYEGRGRRQLTSDGDVYSADISPGGDLLLGRRAGDGSAHIWLRAASGTERELTSGTKDVTPAFAPDGKSWAYADYSNGTIRICKMNGPCEDVLTDRDLPGFPTFAPGGRRLAVATQIGRPQVKVVETDGRLLASWDALPTCGVMWASDDRVWTVENVQGMYHWSEHEAATGETTGKRVRFANPYPDDSPVVDCRAEGAVPGSPLFRRIQAEPDERAEVRVGVYSALLGG